MGLKGNLGYGDFGNLAGNYQRARKQFPDAVMKYILAQIPAKEPRILDVACGTGIATRQLRDSGAQVCGTDISIEMITRAHGVSDDISFAVAPAEKQPFDDNSFDAVTVFSAFHWFPQIRILREFQRLLKKDGFLFVVNKHDTGNFKKRFRDILQASSVTPLPDVRKNYHPDILLRAGGFENVRTENFPSTEVYTNKETISFIQSSSLWNLVPEDRKAHALERIHAEIEDILNGSKLMSRNLDVVVVSGRSGLPATGV